MCDRCEKDCCMEPVSVETNDNPETEWKPEDSNLLKHAKRELQFAGYDLNQEEEDPNKWMVGDVLELLTVFAKQGHSGFSAPYCIKYFKKLAKFEPLTPLQGTDDEWNSLTSLDETFQNVRCSKIFKSKNGVSYTIDGYVFWHWSERPLYEYEVGYPGTTRYKSCFKSNMSRKLIKFPYIPEKPEYIEVDSFEVNKETEEREPGSGWWKTIYPENIIEENSKLTKMLEKEK